MEEHRQLLGRRDTPTVRARKHQHGPSSLPLQVTWLRGPSEGDVTLVCRGSIPCNRLVHFRQILANSCGIDRTRVLFRPLKVIPRSNCK